MGTIKKVNGGSKWKELDTKIEKGLKKTAAKLIMEKKKNNSLLIIADKKGKVKKIPADQL